MEKTEQNIYKLLESDPLIFNINIEKPTIWQKMKKIKSKEYKINALVLSDYIKIAELFDVCKELITPQKDEELLINSIQTIVKYKSEIVKIISIFLKENQKFIRENLTIPDIQKIIIKIIEFNDFTQFFFTLTLAKQKITIRQEPEN